MAETITIILADDHNLVRQGFKAILAAEPTFVILEDTGDGLDAARLVEIHHPDVLITDLMMPGLNGLELTRQVTRRSSETKVILLSMFDSDAYVLEALRSGALGYVLKDSDASDLVKAVREVVNGRRYLSALLSERAIDAYLKQAESDPFDVLETLTAREREVMLLAAQNVSNQEVAERLHISRRTAETHRSNLMRKLNLHNQAELVRFAFEKGLIMPRNTPIS